MTMTMTMKSRSNWRRFLPMVATLGLLACEGDATDEDFTPWPTTQDPCEGVPLEGRCEGAAIALCIAGSGSAEPFVYRFPCGDGLTCGEGAYGVACVTSGACRPGETECRGDSRATCGGGQWQTEACAGGCVDTALGSDCRTGLPTTRYRNTLEYEYRAVNAGWTGWTDESYRAVGQGFLVVSFADGELLDATVTDNTGSFELDVVAPAYEDDDDFISIVAARVSDSRTELAYAIMDPGVPATQQDVNQRVVNGMDAPKPWVWTVRPSVLPSMSELYLPLSAGSAAAYVFDYLRYVHGTATGFYGERDGTSLAVWFGFGTTWSCGACFTRAPSAVLSFDFSSQIFMPASATDEAYWSDAVIAHELGHWLMSTYGASPGEGGKHILGIPTHPGIAWSEGFATWLSTLVRESPTYYDKQGGLFFWIDLGARTYSQGQSWRRPIAAEGLEQLIDENEVARVLIGLATEQTVNGMLAALLSPRMTQSPYLKGYERRTWNGLDDNGNPTPYESTDVSAPHLADYLDALVCDGVHSADAIDTHTEPWLHYPYPSASPSCRSGELPIQVEWRKLATATVADVRWYVPLERDLVLDFRPSVSGPTIVPAGTGPGALSLVFETSDRGPLSEVVRPLGIFVETGGDDWGISGTSKLIPDPTPAPIRDGPRVVIGGKDYGPSVRIGQRPTELPPRRPIHR